MTLSKRGDYVMKSAIYLARAWIEGVNKEADGVSVMAGTGFIDEAAESKVSRKIREIVKDTLIPNTFAPQILADLIRAGLAVSKAGRFGGYRLARDPSLISALEVVEAAEGSLRADRCALGDEPCRWEDVCPLHETWVLAGQAVAKVLQETTLAELATRDIAIENGTYKLITNAHRSHPISIDVKDKVQIEVNFMQVLKGIIALSGTKEAELLLNDAYEAAIGTSAGLQGLVSQIGKMPANGSVSFTLARSQKSISRKNTLNTGKAVKKSSLEESDSAIAFLWKGNSNALIESLEGQIMLTLVDEERTELSLEAKLRQPSSGQFFAKETFGEVSAKFIRHFLRRLAVLLEDES
ncbi:MAG: Rrf2 family transcriptional regulator [Firmicutes bacterium]|nr:Rrf2 family transcriptional regulator [Bacillota bacterium]